MALQTPRRRTWFAVAMVLALTALVTGAWALRAWQPFADDAQSVEWPENVQPLADFVERETGLPFLDPIDVEFLGRDEFEQRLDDAVEEPSEEALATALDDEALGRALGYWNGEPELARRSAQLREASNTLVEWDGDDTILVQADGPDAELMLDAQADLVLALTEIVDQQHFDLDERIDAAPTAQDFQVLVGLDLGQALWVRDRWLDELTLDEHDRYEEQRADRNENFADATDDVDPVFRSLRIVGQALGPAFVLALHESGRRDAFEIAIRDDVPAAVDQLMLPTGKYERRDELEPVDAPPVPKDAELVYTRQLGPYGLYLLMAGGLPPTEALQAADGWGNDSFVAYRLDDRLCVDARIVADSRTDADRIERGLDAWGHARPDESDALVGRDGDTLLLSVCDPGTDVRQRTPVEASIQQFFGRADLLQSRIEVTGLPALSECVTVRWFETHLAVDDLSMVMSEFDPFGQLDDLTDECRNSV
ncbi:MAG: hypothetical protein RL238_2272 [Actinomycetota bacterium]|jgi:hypothetical protein